MGVEKLMNGLEENFIITKSRRGKCSKGNGALIGVSATFRPASRFLKLLHTPVIKASRDQLLMVFDLLTPEKKVDERTARKAGSERRRDASFMGPQLLQRI